MMINGPDDAGRFTVGLKNRFAKIRDGGFTIGAGDADGF